MHGLCALKKHGILTIFARSLPGAQISGTKVISFRTYYATSCFIDSNLILMTNQPPIFQDLTLMLRAESIGPHI